MWSSLPMPPTVIENLNVGFVYSRSMISSSNLSLTRQSMKRIIRQNTEVQNETFLGLNSHRRGRVWTSRCHVGCRARLFAKISGEGCPQGGRLVVHGRNTSSYVGWPSRHDGCLVWWFQRGPIQRHH